VALKEAIGLNELAEYFRRNNKDEGVVAMSRK
jgi:hypothetical protein